MIRNPFAVRNRGLSSTTGPYTSGQYHTSSNYPDDDDINLDENDKLDLFKFNTPMLDQYQQHVMNTPQRRKPGVIETIAAAAASGLTRNPNLGFEMLERPYRETMEDYNTKGRGLGELADIESRRESLAYRNWKDAIDLGLEADRNESQDKYRTGLLSARNRDLDNLANYRSAQIREIDNRIRNTSTPAERQQLIELRARLQRQLAEMNNTAAMARVTATQSAIDKRSGNKIQGISSSQQASAKAMAVRTLFGEIGKDPRWSKFFDIQNANIVKPQPYGWTDKSSSADAAAIERDWKTLNKKLNDEIKRIEGKYRPGSPLNVSELNVDLEDPAANSDARQEAIDELNAIGIDNPTEEEIQQAIEELNAAT